MEALVIVLAIPVFFAMIFAIAMDYTVFLLASAKEHWERTGDAARLTVRAPLATSDAGHGDSISISGVSNSRKMR